MEGTKVILQHGKFELPLKGVTMKNQGFLEVANWMKSEDKILDKFTKGAASTITHGLIEESRRLVIP